MAQHACGQDAAMGGRDLNSFAAPKTPYKWMRASETEDRSAGCAPGRRSPGRCFRPGGRSRSRPAPKVSPWRSARLAARWGCVSPSRRKAPPSASAARAWNWSEEPAGATGGSGCKVGSAGANDGRRGRGLARYRPRECGPAIACGGRPDSGCRLGSRFEGLEVSYSVAGLAIECVAVPRRQQPLRGGWPPQGTNAVWEESHLMIPLIPPPPASSKSNLASTVRS